MATIEKRLTKLEAARPADYSRKLSVLVPDDATDQEMQQARLKYRCEVFRVSADPFEFSFLG